MNSGLNVIEIEDVKRLAAEKLGVCRKTNDIIGMQIFSILGLYARAIYYPLGENAPWGFTRISGSRDDADLKKPFVAINTSIPVDCQVFAAAHELYHIWYENAPDMLPSDLLDENNKAVNEKKANRFAAEFLVDKVLLGQEIEIYKLENFTVKSVLQLADLFVVPYKAMARRLHETGFISERKLRSFISVPDETLMRFRKMYSIPLKKPDNRITVDNLTELAVNAYEHGLISYEKFEYLLEICGLEPRDFGVARPTENMFPSDEELDSIMEESV